MARQLARRRGRAVEVDTDTDEGYQDEPNDEAEQGGGRRGQRGGNHSRAGRNEVDRPSRRSPERASKRPPVRSGRAGRDRSSSAIQRGWEASRANRARSGSF